MKLEDLKNLEEIKLNSLIQGECLEVMKFIRDKSIDMILCDLPYGTTSCKWDSIIPFDLLWKQYKRIIKDNGAIVLFGLEPFSSHLRLSNLEWYKYDWIWEKTKVLNFFNAKNKPMNKHEIISVFSEGTCANGSNNLMKYFPQNLIKINKLTKGKRTGSDDHRFYRENHPNTRIQEFTNYPHSILKFASEGNTIHPTQKPVELFEYLIKTYTSETELVLDNCSGSGTTAIACLNTNRNFICIEKDLKYFNKSQERIQKHQNILENRLDI